MLCGAQSLGLEQGTQMLYDALSLGLEQGTQMLLDLSGFMGFKLLNAGFETCFGPSTQGTGIPISKHISIRRRL